MFKEGDYANSMFFIIEGSIKILKKNFRGNSKVLTELSAPHFFGEMSIFDTQKRSADVIAATTVIIAELPCHKVKDLYSEYPKVAIYILEKIIQSLSCKLRAINSRHVNFGLS